MKASLEPFVYGDPPVTKLRRKCLSCGHDRGRAFVARNQATAWCFDCGKHVRMVRIPRLWKRWPKRS